MLNEVIVERTSIMTRIARAAEYRYVSFTYAYGKAYFGCAEARG